MSDLGSGRIVAVVGASGTGKDSLISAARERFSGDERFCFPRRVVTRPMHEASEDHDSLSVEEFAQAERQGHFALVWQAHGYHYGIPAQIMNDVAAGCTVTLNVSRMIIPRLEQLFPHVLVVHVSCDAEILVKRIASRGRENAEEIKRRLGREAPLTVSRAKLVHLVNDGALHEAATRFAKLVAEA